MLVVALFAVGAAQAGTGHMSIEQVKALSAEKDVPILLKVGTEWCSACQAFDKAVAENAGFKADIDRHVVLAQIDAEKGEGVDVAKMYGVKGYPTFLLVNAKGEVMDRWMGFNKEEGLTSTLTAALEDPTTLSEKMERFRTEPNVSDAIKIGDIRACEGFPAEAVAYYSRAASLDSDADVQSRLFQATMRGSKAGVFTLEDVKRQADAVFASNAIEPAEMMEVTYAMKWVAKGADNPGEYYHPYLKATVEATANTTDEMLTHKRQKFLADYALHIEKNEKKAVKQAKLALGDNWQENANTLNNFAWWCFENTINLDEAEKMARRGIELAQAGKEKANILDTLAEICNVKGDCGDAVEYIRLAIAEAPDNEYFQSQLTRFEELLASQSR